MPQMRLTTIIDAPPETVFDLCLDVETHISSTGGNEKVVGGVTSGLLGPGDTVTWRAWHFGIPWTMESRITGYERPKFFIDEQERGPFESWWHRHDFSDRGGRTIMTDDVRYTSPVGPLGRLADRVVLEGYLERMLEQRNSHLKELAEGTRHADHS